VIRGRVVQDGYHWYRRGRPSRRKPAADALSVALSAGLPDADPGESYPDLPHPAPDGAVCPCGRRAELVAPSIGPAGTALCMDHYAEYVLRQPS
jgi:hypothetical protein